MATEALRCPTCGGADSSRSDANGIHTCVYCDVRYRITTSGPSSIDAPRSHVRSGSRVAIVVGVLAVMVIIGAATFVVRTATNAVSVAAPPAGSPAVPVVAVPSISGEPEAPAVATFALEHRRASSGSTFYLIGWVTNASPYTVDKPKVTAVLLDDAGNEVGTAFGFADDVLDAGARAPVTVLVMDPPAHARIEYEVVARKASYIPERATGLRLEHGEVGPGQFGSGHRVQGKVWNDGERPARFVNVRVQAFDAEGKLLGVDDTYADGELLPVGGSARFDLNMMAYEAPPTKFELAVQASPAP